MTLYGKHGIIKQSVRIILIILISIESVLAIPVLLISDFNDTHDFTGKPVVLIKKGDSPEYRKPEFDDSKWKITSFPSNWNELFPDYTGICWYRLHISLSRELPQKSIGIRLGVICDADEVYFNGKMIGKSGQFPPDRKHAYDIKRIYEIPTSLIKPGKDNVLAIRISGFFHNANGVYKDKFQIAIFQELQKDFLSREFFDLFFVVLYLSVSLYFGLVFVRTFADKANLIFSLFTLSTGVYLFLRTQIKYFISSDFMALKLIEYITLFLIFVLTMEFITFYFNRKHTLLHYFYFLITIISMLLIVFSKNIIFWHQVLHYIVQPSWIIPISFSIYVLSVNLKKGNDAKYLLFAFFILSATVMNDILVHRVMYNFIRLSNYGFLVLILGIVIIMRNRFIRLHNELDHLKKKGSSNAKITSDSKKKIDDAINYLNENYTSDISREGLAEAVCINPDYFGKTFKKYTGKKIGEYINDLRIKKALEMLLDDEINVIDVAFAVGFESLSTFYRVFQKVMGESPKNYIERNKK